MSIKGQSPSPFADSADAWVGIAEDLSELACVTYLDDVQLSDGLLAGSIKNAAVIACSDMGWLVPYVCSSPKVQLFLFQNFGHQFASGGFVETVVQSEVEHVIVYGHSVCEYTNFLARIADDQAAPVEAKDRRELYFAPCESDREAVLENVVRYNVLLELKKMLADPSIAAITRAGNLKVHAWVYNSTNQKLEVFDPARLAFIVPPKLPDSSVLSLVPDEGYR